MHVKEQIEPFDKTAKSYNLFWDNGNTSFTVFELKTAVHPPPLSFPRCFLFHVFCLFQSISKKDILKWNLISTVFF